MSVKRTCDTSTRHGEKLIARASQSPISMIPPDLLANPAALTALAKLNPLATRFTRSSYEPAVSASGDFVDLDLAPSGANRFAQAPAAVFTTTGGVRIVYEYSHGPKTPVVILGGGLTGRIESCRTYGAEDDRYRNNAILIFDRRNTGSSDVQYSDMVGGSVTELDAQVADIVALLSHLKLPPVILYGHSSGARIFGKLAIARPDMVAAMVLCSLTGGKKAAKELGRQYYTAHANAVEREGMAALLARPAFAQSAQRNGKVAPYLLSLPVSDFLVDAYISRRPRSNAG